MSHRPRHVIRRRPVRALAALAVAAVVAAVVVVAAPAQAAVFSPFTQVYSQNAHGNIAIVGNTVLTCVGGAGTQCENAQNGTSAPWVNNSFTSRFVDVDSAADTFDSSSSTLTLPSDGSVLHAELVWGGRIPNGSTTAGSDATKRGSVRFTTPDGIDHELTGQVASAPAATNPTPYQGSFDVTSLVAQTGSGSYTVANVQTAVGGGDQYGGWALVVAYSDPNAVERNLTIYRGLAQINNNAGSQTETLPFDGFTTPPYGQVKTEVGFVTYEGDRGNNDVYRGDSVDLKGSTSAAATPITDARNPANDVFNSTMTTDAVDTGARSPHYDNQLGFDADVINADGVLKNNETSATITLKTGGEAYYPGVVTFATQLYDPQLNGTKTATLDDANGNGLADNGEVLTYSVSIRNDGLDDATKSTFFDAIPTGTTYVPGSLSVDGASVSDVPGDDLGEYSSTPVGHVTARYGTGAAASRGGRVVPYSTDGTAVHTVAFSVRIGNSAAANPGQRILNAADLGYVGATSGAAGASVSNLTTSVVPGGTAGGPSAPNRTLAFDPTASTPALAIDLLGSVTGGTKPYSLIAETDPAGGTLVDNGNGTVSYTPRADFAGRDVFTYTVQDANGLRSTATVKIDVLNDAPVTADDSANVSHLTPTTLTPTSNDTDANGDPITVYSVSANGSTATEGQPAITLASGATIKVVGGKVVYTPATSASVNQTDTFTYVAQDSRGFRSSTPGTVTVTLTNSAPTAVNDSLATTHDAATAVSIDPRSNDTDPDGDGLAVTGVGTAAHGSVSSTSTSVSYMPNAGYAGTDSFTYTISDGFGGTATATVNVSVDGPPTAVADTFTAAGGSTTVSGNVITDPTTGDSDPNGDTLTLVSVGAPTTGSIVRTPAGAVTLTVPQYYVGPQTVPYRITDGTTSVPSTVTFIVQNIAPTAASGATATIPATTGGRIDLFGLVSDPNVTAGFQHFTLQSATASNGAVVTDNGDGTVKVKPAAGNKNPITLSYTVSDGATTVTSTVAITVDDNAPSATPNAVSIPTNGIADVDAAADDTDPDGDALTVTAVGAPLDGNGVQQGASSIVGGEVHYVPPMGYTGSVTMSYTVSDGTKTASSTVTVTVRNAAPVTQDDAVDVKRTGSTPVPVTGNDTDANGDAITVRSVTANGSTITDGQSLTTAAGGKLALSGGVITYTAPSGGLATGATEAFTYVAEDARGTASATPGSVTLTAVNRGPSATGDALTVLKNGTAKSIDPRGNDTDPDGDTLTVTAVGTAAHGTVSFTGTSVAYTPTAGYAGADSFSYTVSDGSGATSQATVTVKVDGAPSAAPVTYTVAGSGSAMTFGGNLITDAPVTDPNGDPVSLTALGSTTKGTSTFTSGGNVSYAVAAGYLGTETVSYTVSDGTSATVSSVTFVVNNVAPTATPGSATIGSGAGGTVAVQGNVTDPNAAHGYQQLTTTAASATDGATATVQPDGTVKVVPASGFTGPLTLTYTVSDGTASVTSTVSVNVVNGSAPAANPETVHTATDTRVDAAVLTNDTDADGDALTVKTVGTPIDSASAPTGTATIVGGKVRYTPPTGFAGTVTIPYTITDGGFESTTTLTVIVDDAAPVANPDTAAATDYRTVTTTDVLANDSDANIPGTPQVLVITGATADHGATVQIQGSSLKVTPAAGYRGPIAVDYTVTDGAGASTVGRLTVTVGNSPAMLGSQQVSSTGGAVSVDLLAGSSDPDGDSVAVASVGPALGPDGRQHGTVSRNGNRITVTPAAGYSGTLTVSYTVTDAGGGTSIGSVTITVAPTAASTARTTRSATGSLATTGVAPASLLGLLALLFGGAATLLELERRRRLREEPRHIA